ncbi:MAG: hypothetical protein A2622_11820 [Bdellovibrionales bacterium RIFCSPHIGHO2_01_FULL_40_29]|nr:MAG: hypothetical protein A2622_11820 [Bdellovibrionales bacterium RIFCSPHIGHO2_01_FULL_40_29]OFZ35294.1 MAG: hypothetical protein A3D17_08815 [Bdellovibrionales bacterium RIFCSPHIGHO2_02_FULL_40_15]
MKKFSYFQKSLVLLFWVLIVTAVFRIIEDRQIAALIAGSGFVLWPGLFLWDEIRSLNRYQFVIGGVLQFWVLFAVPIFLLRILNWGAEFNSLSFAGVPAGFLHRYANGSYLLMLLALSIAAWIERNKKRQPKG